MILSILGLGCLLCVVVSGFKTATVVGSGPVGLASALVLAKRHGYQVTVLESAERIDVYDPRKGYPFLIGERGQRLTKLFPSLLHEPLKERGVGVQGPTQLVSIPADPKEVVDLEPKEITIFRPSGERFWVPRHEFTKILLDAATKTENITLVNGVSCRGVKTESDSEIIVCTESKDEYGSLVRKEYKSSILIAADGMNSAVRESLSKPESSLSNWVNGKPKGFQVKRWNSPSSGLKFKTLHMNPKAKIPVGDGTEYQIPFNTQTFHALRSQFKSPKTAMSLGILPCREVPSRAMNVIRLAKHDIWEIRDGNKLKEWFSEAFPRLDFGSDTPMIEQEEFDRFAANDGLTLPPVQYSPELQVQSHTGNAAVIILGDAAHTFPPDLGEGVNSGLEDVVALDEALTNNETPGEMATSYAKARKPETKALVKIATHGAPFQYGQSGGLLTVKRILWTLNFGARLILNKLSFGLTPPQLAIQISQTNLAYSVVWKRAQMLTLTLWMVFAGIMARAFGLL
ncbi:unnamed protein product [Cylindrotheca closterium]|uniref:FAD-binding domain-containing protein n=1 Tax=Cylindrotheca closterium TaxID=2856 RepID=A0AAD2FWK3_9STRA|nr:unnamed protein product [Cylindrotheca closterium]